MEQSMPILEPHDEDRELLHWMLVHLTKEERVELAAQMSDKLQLLRQGGHENQQAFTDWLDSWYTTMRLRVNGDFQLQSKEFIYRDSRDELGNPVEAEGLRDFLQS